jgi:Ca2+/Na+ antiporter
MAYSPLLKTNLVLLVLVIICIGASVLALYSGNTKFIGILGIALLALCLVFWRIFSLARSGTSEKQRIDVDFDFLERIRPPEK